MSTTDIIKSIPGIIYNFFKLSTLYIAVFYFSIFGVDSLVED